MIDRPTDETNLALTEKHIAEAEKRISELMKRIDDLTSQGMDCMDEARYLSVMRETLKVLQHQRAFLIKRLNENP
jgi:hypothetical protein